MSLNDEFYVGYAPPMPPRLARFVTRAVAVAAAGVAGASVLVAIGHRRIEGGTFQFGERHTIAGVLTERPYPAVRVDNDGGATSIPLVAPGKHGADALVRGLDGTSVTLEGARIRRDGLTMLEVIPGSVARTSDATGGTPSAPLDGEWREVTVRGEIVDSKCFLGVMVPGDGTTHRACASLCLRGGIPPALFVREADGGSTLLLLETHDGEPIGARAVDFAGAHVAITGRRGQHGEWPILRSDPAAWTRVAPPGAER